MAPNISRKNRKTAKTFFCDSCMLHGNGTLERHDSDVHRPTPSMYLKKRVLKKIFSPKSKKTMVSRNESNSSNYLKCHTCQEYVPFRMYIEHLIEHGQRSEESQDTIIAEKHPFVRSYTCKTDDDIEEFRRRRYLYPRNDPKFNGPDSILTCLTCDDLFMNLVKFERHSCPKEIEVDMEEIERRRFLYPRDDPRFNVEDDSMLTCLKCEEIFDSCARFEQHNCHQARQISFVTLDDCMNF